jgi:uncharacterized protein YecE (DUF72 family)
VWVGTAGWQVPRASIHRGGPVGSHLERYSQVLRCVEINSSFYRPHAFATYAKWAASTPPWFRFALKVPRAITHEQRLVRPRALLVRFLEESGGLGVKRGPLLVQLPPSLAFESGVASRFFRCLRGLHAGPVVCEPRHGSWFTTAADLLLQHYRVGRVVADPPRGAGADQPAGSSDVVYFRLHGSPRTYWSRYTTAYLAALTQTIQSQRPGASLWVVFDNTAAGAAFENALELTEMLENAREGRHR